MESLRQDLQKKLVEHPDNITLKNALKVFDDLKRLAEGAGGGAKQTQPHLMHFARHSFIVLLQDLRDQGLIGETEEELGHLSDALRFLAPDIEFSTGELEGEEPESEDAIDLSFLLNSRQNVILQHAPWNKEHDTHKKHDHIAELNEAYFLHLLATAPEKVLPPGKSLRSVLLNPSSIGDWREEKKDQKEVELHQRVSEIAHRAFWDEALESLRTPIPSAQIARLKRLYADLANAVNSVLDESAPSYIALTSPLSPTTSPLTTTLRHLRALTQDLRRICAPARDEALDDVLRLLDDITVDPAQRVIDSMKELLRISELMSGDLSAATANLVSDAGLAGELARIARERERKVVLHIWGENTLRQIWKTWVDEAPAEDVRWIRRLVKALGADVPVSCNLHPSDTGRSSQSTSRTASPVSSNTIPLVFVFTIAQLIRIQNEIQALVIAACLRTLLPPRRRLAPPSSSAEEGPGFMERVIALLMLEVDPDSDSSTKLLNLGDEVLREYKRVQPDAEINEQTVRAHVDRVLRPTDPVFNLLRQRLLDRMADRLSSVYVELARKRHVPSVVRAGRAMGQSQRNLDALIFPQGHTPMRVVTIEEVGDIPVRGFDDPVLRKAIAEVVREASTVIEWIRSVWEGSLEGFAVRS